MAVVVVDEGIFFPRRDFVPSSYSQQEKAAKNASLHQSLSSFL